MKLVRRYFIATAVAATVAGAAWFGEARAATVFFDNFNAAPNALWGNEAGSWTTNGGVYSAQAPGNFPNSHSLVSSLTLTDYTASVTVLNSNDGGVWMRAANNGSSIGVQGVLLVTRSNNLYWHVVAGNSYGAALNQVVLTLPASYSLEVVAQGNLYSAYVNSVLVTTLNNSTYSSGLTGLYDFSAQSFDDFRVDAVPVPAALPLLASALIGGGVIAWRKKRKQKAELIAA